jgi:O-methyltransferase
MKLVTHPGTYGPVALSRLEAAVQMRCARLVARSAFFMQGQMDIHPKSVWHNPAFRDQTGGFFLPGDDSERRIVDVDPWDSVRRDMLILLMRSLLERGIEGELAELGVWKGGTAKLFHHYLPERTLSLFDTFSGFDERDVEAEKAKLGNRVDPTSFSDTSVGAVLAYVEPRNDNVVCYPGFFPASVPPGFDARRFALVHLDADLYDPISAGLKFFYPRIARGGYIIVHDYNAWPGARRAVADFFRDRPEIPIPMPDKSGSALIVKL